MANIAVTGATGLVGSHLSNRFSEMGHTVFALVKDENSKSFLSKGVTRIYGDIGNRRDTEYFVQKSNPRYFIHLAAQTQAYDSLKYPYQTFYNNVVGTLNVLESLREFSLCEAVIVASSDKAYGELKTDFYTESHELRGIYPYDASKSATDLIANSYRETYKMPIAITRACNIYGVGDYNRQRLIPGIVAAHKEQSKFKIRNRGADLREYINVDDVVDAYIKIVEYILSTNQESSFNISSGDRKSTLEVFKLVEQTIGRAIPVEIAQEEGLEIKKQFMNSSLLEDCTGWSPKHTLATTINETVDWYLKHL
jgi:CDP-glucose 4,6-dehydratase